MCQYHLGHHTTFLAAIVGNFSLVVCTFQILTHPYVYRCLFFFTIRLLKSLPNNLFQNISIAVFSLGDRCYGPDKYCAAGRKLIIRLRQLGATLLVNPGYGDDNTPNGGIFIDLDQWLYNTLLPHLFPLSANNDDNEIANVQRSISNLDEIQKHPIYNITISPGDKADVENITVYPVKVKIEEWQKEQYRISYQEFFERQRPPNAYRYEVKHSDTNIHKHQQREIIRQPRCSTNDMQYNDKDQDQIESSTMLLGRVVENRRLTALNWEQNTRHIRLDVAKSIIPTSRSADEAKTIVTSSSYNNDANDVVHQKFQWSLDKLPYQAGDVAAILPSNTMQEVNAFLNVLPMHLQQLADCDLLIHCNNDNKDSRFVFSGIGYRYWPYQCTFRGLLTYCADIHALPEREDLRALAPYCSHCSNGKQQRDKLISLSETKDSALYVDYIIREKRSWVDVLYDFDSLRDDGSKLTIEAILGLLLPIRPRLFSIASSPTKDWMTRNEKSSTKEAFSVELCVAAVEGTTRHGRKFHGLCSSYLCNIMSANEINPPPFVRLWIQPGSFHGLPLHFPSVSTTNTEESLSTPVMCIGAGTGIAPLRSIIQERVAKSHLSNINTSSSTLKQIQHPCSNILIFGCRKKDMDFYYEDEWNILEHSGLLQILTAFSQDQWHKVYVQQVLESEKFGREKIVRHLIDNEGAIYIAGGPKMARAVNDVVLEALCQFANCSDEKNARKTLSKLQYLGLYSVEAWS